MNINFMYAYTICSILFINIHILYYTIQPHSHVISSIVHITHKYDNDNEPWPIEIEDHDGNIHAVNLKMGEVSRIPWVLLLFHMGFIGLCIEGCN